MFPRLKHTLSGADCPRQFPDNLSDGFPQSLQTNYCQSTFPKGLPKAALRLSMEYPTKRSVSTWVAGDFQGHPARFLGRFSQYVVSNSVDSFPYELLPRQFAEPVALIAFSLTYQFQQHCFVLCSSTRQPSWPAFLGSFPNLLSSHKFVSSEIKFPRSFLVSEWCFEVG